MGLFDLFDSFDSGSSILDFGLDALGITGDSSPLGGFSGSFLPALGSQPFNVGFQQPIQTMATVPMAARAVAAGLPRWSAQYPNLWQAIQRLRATGAKSGISFLSSMLRKWGPTALTGVIGAAAVADLVSYKMTHKPRRMNPANTRALRRSLRRLKSFDKLSHRVSMQLARTGGSRRRAPSRSRCTVCRRNPCSC